MRLFIPEIMATTVHPHISRTYPVLSLAKNFGIDPAVMGSYVTASVKDIDARFHEYTVWETRAKDKIYRSGREREIRATVRDLFACGVLLS